MLEQQISAQMRTESQTMRSLDFAISAGFKSLESLKEEVKIIFQPKEHDKNGPAKV